MVCQFHFFFLSGILKSIRERNKRFAYSRTGSQIELTFSLKRQRKFFTDKQYIAGSIIAQK